MKLLREILRSKKFGYHRHNFLRPPILLKMRFRRKESVFIEKKYTSAMYLLFSTRKISDFPKNPEFLSENEDFKKKLPIFTHYSVNFPPIPDSEKIYI